MKAQTIWLIGASDLAQEYCKVMQQLGLKFSVICRTEVSSQNFHQNTGVQAISGGVDRALTKYKSPDTAIVAVGIEDLKEVALSLILAGVRRILVEKPGALRRDDLVYLLNEAAKFSCELFIGYNRRFYQSVAVVRDGIEEDGGATSMRFDFTEWAFKVRPLKQSHSIKNNWVLANSSHVLDLAFHLCGQPKDWRCWSNGSLDWHPRSARFCGAGLTTRGVLFSYCSDWSSPGRWGLEIMTTARTFILRPLENVSVLHHGEVSPTPVHNSSTYDKDFKPGLYQQVFSFLNHDDRLLCPLVEQLNIFETYIKMAKYQ